VASRVQGVVTEENVMLARFAVALALVPSLFVARAASAQEADEEVRLEGEDSLAPSTLTLGRALGGWRGRQLHLASDETGAIHTCLVRDDGRLTCRPGRTPSARGAWATLGVGVVLVAAGTVPLARGLEPFDFREPNDPDPGLVAIGALGITLGAAFVATAIVRLTRFKSTTRLLDRMSFAVAPMRGPLDDARGARATFGLAF
jgi:hypothetical protein